MSVRADLKIFERVRDFIFKKMAATLQVRSSQINNFIKKVDDDNFVVCGRKRLFSAVFLNKGCDFGVCAFQEAKMADFLDFYICLFMIFVCAKFHFLRLKKVLSLSIDVMYFDFSRGRH